MQVTFHHVAGIRTRLLSCGGGLPVLLLHPVGFSADIWFRNIPALGRHMHAVAPDLLGHGFTDLYDPAGQLGHKPIFDHLTALVDDFGWDEFAVIGSSFGGQLAALLALSMPDRVKRLVIVGSGTALQDQAATTATLTRTLANASTALDTPTWNSCRTRLANLCFDKTRPHNEIILSQLTAYALPGAAEAYKRLLAAMLDVEAARPYRVRERLGEIEAPTLLVWGREDPRADVRHAQSGVSFFKDARLVTFDGCGHLPFLEHPERFEAAMVPFLTALNATQTHRVPV